MNRVTRIVETRRRASQWERENANAYHHQHTTREVRRRPRQEPVVDERQARINRLVAARNAAALRERLASRGIRILVTCGDVVDSPTVVPQPTPSPAVVAQPIPSTACPPVVPMPTPQTASPPTVPMPTPQTASPPVVAMPTPQTASPPIVAMPTPQTASPPVVPTPTPQTVSPPVVPTPTPQTASPPVVAGLNFEADYTLSEDDLRNIEVIRSIGEGANGKVELVRYKGEDMVLKTMINGGRKHHLLREATIQIILSGAGGAPLVRGLAFYPARLLMTSAGQAYETYLEDRWDWEVIESLISVGMRLSEIHEKGVIHNDLKIGNVTVTQTDEDDPVFHIIDFGLSGYPGQVLSVKGDPEEQYWMDPEILQGRPISTASDVYSFGCLICELGQYDIQDDGVRNSLWQLMEPAIDSDPQQRPSLLSLVRDLQVIAESQAEIKEYCLERRRQRKC